MMRTRAATELAQIFINQSIWPYYRKPYALIKDLNNKSLIDSCWILNGTMKIMESNQLKTIISKNLNNS